MNQQTFRFGHFGIFLTLMGTCSTSVWAAGLTLAPPFADHMVIQRGKPIELWGTGDAKAEVVVTFAGKEAKATAGDDGVWRAKLEPLVAGGPFELTASSGGANAAVKDVLVGDLFLCSGQSNMQYSLGECADANAVATVPHPLLRLGKVQTAWEKQPVTKADINWSAADPAGAKKFAAVAYCFAHELENDPAMKDVPVGLLQCCLGATVIESWLPENALTRFDKKDLQSSMFGIGPTMLYNGMISPLGKSSFAGVIWYQGEGNAGEPARYAKYLPLLFKSWREQFDDPALPFLVVQLPDYATEWGGVFWQWMRESQATAVGGDAHAQYVVSINTNDGWNLHPQGKHEIGRRLALLVRQTIYKEQVVGKGPVFKSAKADGAKMVISFDTVGDKLVSDGGVLNGFALAGPDGVYHAADAMIDGDTVVVSSTDVHEPATVRYAWAGVPKSTLTNSSGVPAAPFRTDEQTAVKGRGEAQDAQKGFTFRSKDYKLDISADGAMTSLIVGPGQLLSNAPGQWGGARVAGRNMEKVKVVNAQQMVCSNNETSITYDFGDDSIRITVTNNHKKENAVFHVALNASVNVGDDGAELKRKGGVNVKTAGVEKVITFKDVAAEDGKVLETTVAPGAKKVIELTLSK